jgi:hypothetical protein
MNRERAETFLRLLAEAEIRAPQTRQPPARRSPDAPLITLPVKVARVTWALVAVGALEGGTAETILADVEMAVAARMLPEHGPSLTDPVWPSGPVPQRFPLLRPRVYRGKPARAPAPAAAAAGSAGAPGRYVPLGQMILFHDQAISGEVDLMSYAHTVTGARLVATWRARNPLGWQRHIVPPVDQFEVTDDRGNGYDLRFSTKGRPESTCDLTLDPAPPADLRWLDITTPGEATARVDLQAAAPAAESEVSPADLSSGEHLLTKVAEGLLLQVPDLPRDPQAQAIGPGPIGPGPIGPGPIGPGPLAWLAAGLGDVIAALRAAEVLPEDSPLPGRLATLCASLRVFGHGITAAPALDLPEPWLSLLAYYQRRKPGQAQARDDFAGLVAELPELDGFRLVLLGLHHFDHGGTWINALAMGQIPDHNGALGLDMVFPLSIWVHDSAGRWHAARPVGWYDNGGEYLLTLRLTPPLPRSGTWIEVLAAGRSAKVRTTVPLRWGYLS